MSCTLLAKLAPETRTLIYEYALTFDTPLKHVHKMRPFLEKSGQSTESTESNKSKAQTALSEESPATSDSVNRVNTSILTASKLIYKEAITVFYKHNIIRVDTAICKPENTTTLRATDLSLAKQVTVESVQQIDPRDGRTDRLGQVSRFVGAEFWLMFPKCKAVTVYVYTDAHPMPVLALFAIAAKLRSLPGFAEVKFDGVGSVVAYPICPPDQAKFNLVIQCRTTVDHWAKDQVISDPGDLMTLSMRALRDLCNANDPSRTADILAQGLFKSWRHLIVPIDYPIIQLNSFEFWTVADEGLRQMRLDIQREQLVRSAPVERASPDSDSDSDYAPPEKENDQDLEEDSEEDSEDDSEDEGPLRTQLDLQREQLARSAPIEDALSGSDSDDSDYSPPEEEDDDE